MFKKVMKIMGCVCLVGVGTVLQSLTGNLVVNANNYIVSRFFSNSNEPSFKAEAKIGF